MNYEDELQLIMDKIDEANDYTWAEIAEMIDYPYTVDALRKSLAGKYGGFAVYNYLKDKAISSNDLSQLKDDLYKERVKLQDALREKRSILREEARYENLVELLKSEIKNLPQIEIKEKINDGKYFKYAILQLSDFHAGALCDNQWNYFNFEVLQERAEEIVNKTIYYCSLHEITDLVVEIGGDMVHGVINVSNRVDAEEDVLTSILKVSELLSQMIAKLKENFRIKVVTVLGNHGRLMADKKAVTTKENFEMLIPEFLRLRLKMPIQDSKGLDFTKYEINGNTICLCHGHNNKLNTIIEDFSKLYKCVPDEIHCGHFHAYKDVNDCDIMVTVNGTLMGADDYALTIKKNTTPSQNLIIYDEDRWITQLKVN